jgi:hypothetical protein
VDTGGVGMATALMDRRSVHQAMKMAGAVWHTSAE